MRIITPILQQYYVDIILILWTLCRFDAIFPITTEYPTNKAVNIHTMFGWAAVHKHEGVCH